MTTQTQPLLMRLMKQREKLDKQIEETKQRERHAVIQRMLQAGHAYGITKGELFYGDKLRKPDDEMHFEMPADAPAAAAPPGTASFRRDLNKYPFGNYRGASGQTWDGNGVVPRWLKHNTKTHDAREFIINADGVTPFELAHPGGSRQAKAAQTAKSRKQRKNGAAKTNGHASFKAKKPKGTYPPKYRNPEDANETWTGRGRMSNWLEQKVKQGRAKEDFLIAKQ